MCGSSAEKLDAVAEKGGAGPAPCADGAAKADDDGDGGDDAEMQESSLASRVRYWRSTTTAGHAFDALDVAVSVTSIGFFIA